MSDNCFENIVRSIPKNIEKILKGKFWWWIITKSKDFQCYQLSFVISPFCNKIYIYVFPIATSHFPICVVVLQYFGDDHPFQILRKFSQLIIIPSRLYGIHLYNLFRNVARCFYLLSLFSKMSSKCPFSFFSSGFYFYFLCFFFVPFPFEKAFIHPFSIHYIISIPV